MTDGHDQERQGERADEGLLEQRMAELIRRFWQPAPRPSLGDDPNNATNPTTQED